ncbi:sporulation protein YunB [Paenibacillus yanchengensis]|uniref:Sporulation protein YunB n=1 Tax=Paenibacillus yanchengensis TaxID=2035833 RepID=A0ABW4YFP4_9BACL
MTKWGKKRFTFPNTIKKSTWSQQVWKSSSKPKKTSYRKWGAKIPVISLKRLPKRPSSTIRKPKTMAWKWTPATANKQPPKKIKKRHIVLIAMCILLVLSVPAFIFIEKNLRPPLMHIAKVRVKQLATQSINKAITDQVARNSNSEKLIEWKMNGNGKISGFMLNYGEHMRITSATIDTVQTTLTDIKHIPEYIPIGHALNSAIISSFGPRVPVRFEPAGAVKVELSTRQKNAGINMILVEVYIHVMAEVSIIIPFDAEPELVETDIPISYLLVVGDVPMYYYDGTGQPIGESAPQAPSISVPISPGVGDGIAVPTEEEAASGTMTQPQLPEDNQMNNENVQSN